MASFEIIIEDMCAICGDIKPLYSLAICCHKYCIDCHAKYLIKQIKLSKTNIGCMAYTCKFKYEYNDIRQLLSNHTDKFNRYDDNLLCEYLKSDPCWISCIYANCKRGAYRSTSEVRISCLLCKREFCATCSQPWNNVHIDDNKCTATIIPDEESNKVIEKLTRQCPSCKIKIEKSLGCDHMKCVQCDYEFCYICGESYYNNHIIDRHTVISFRLTPIDNIQISGQMITPMLKFVLGGLASRIKIDISLIHVPTDMIVAKSICRNDKPMKVSRIGIEIHIELDDIKLASMDYTTDNYVIRITINDIMYRTNMFKIIPMKDETPAKKQKIV